MVNNSIGLQHVEARRRWFGKLERFPHPGSFKGFLDRMIYVLGFLGIAMSVPQILKIWAGQNAAGISIATWMFFLINSVFWMIYGIAHKSKPIIISYILWIVADFAVVLGAFIY